MSIKNKQSVNLMNNILKKSLIGGTMPTVRELLSKMEIESKGKTFGSPMMKPIFAQEFKKADISSHNNMIEEIANDIDLAYEELIEQGERVVANFIYSKIQSEKLATEIKKTNEELKNLILTASNTNDYIYTVYDYFNDYSKTDIENSTINIKDGSCGMGTKLYKNVRVDSDDFNISFVPLNTAQQNIKNINVTGSLESAIDSSTDSWIYQIESTANGSQGFKLLLSSDTPMECNRLHIIYTSPNKIEISVRYTPDNINWFTIPGTVDNNGHSIDLQFNILSIYSFELTMIKNTSDISDITSAGASFTYVFGIQDIALYHNAYLEDGVLISKEYSIDTYIPVNKISLHTEEDVPSGCSIDYSISVNQGGYINISPANISSPKYEQVIKIEGISSSIPATYKFDLNTPATTYELAQYRTQGIKFYKLDTIPVDTIPNTTVLYKGKDAWEVLKYSVSNCNGSYDEIYELIKTNPPQSAEDMKIVTDNSFTTIDPEYIGINKDNKSSIIDIPTQNSIVHYSVSFMSEVENIIANNPSSNKKCILYFNGILIYDGIPTSKTFVSYNIKQGLNTIDLFIISDTTESSIVNLDLDVYNLSKYVYGHKNPLEYVSLFDLRYNTKYSNHERYAIDGEDIVLNNCKLGLAYDLFYKYHVENISSVKVKAVMSMNKELSDIGPKIKSYQVRFI
jgi:hypothetical protein